MVKFSSLDALERIEPRAFYGFEGVVQLAGNGSNIVTIGESAFDQSMRPASSNVASSPPSLSSPSSPSFVKFSQFRAKEIHDKAFLGFAGLIQLYVLLFFFLFFFF